MDEELRAAAKRGDLQGLESSLDKGAKVDAADEERVALWGEKKGKGREGRGEARGDRAVVEVECGVQGGGLVG